MIGWGDNKPEKELKKTQVMERLMEKSGIAVKEVNLENVSKWGTQHVYSGKGIYEVLGV